MRSFSSVVSHILCNHFAVDPWGSAAAKLKTKLSIEVEEFKLDDDGNTIADEALTELATVNSDSSTMASSDAQAIIAAFGAQVGGMNASIQSLCTRVDGQFAAIDRQFNAVDERVRQKYAHIVRVENGGASVAGGATCWDGYHGWLREFCWSMGPIAAHNQPHTQNQEVDVLLRIRSTQSISSRPKRGGLNASVASPRTQRARNSCLGLTNCEVAMKGLRLHTNRGDSRAAPSSLW